MIFGWREGVIGLIVLVTLYMVFVLFRMRHLAAEKALLERVAQGRTAAPAQANATATDDDEVPVLHTRLETRSPSPLPRASEPHPAEPSRRYDAAPEWPVSGEVQMLREEVAMLRSELAALRADMQHELGTLRATQTVSPIYGDAMQLAISGYPPEQIAERCGIARAEAELVAALARNRDESGD